MTTLLDRNPAFAQDYALQLRSAAKKRISTIYDPRYRNQPWTAFWDDYKDGDFMARGETEAEAVRRLTEGDRVMDASVEIAGQELIVEYDFKITSHGCPAIRPSFSGPGEPAEPMEFEIEIIGARFPKQHADVPAPELPEWLKDVLATHLYERDDVYQDVERAGYERDGGDPDFLRDLRDEDREMDRGQSADDEF